MNNQNTTIENPFKKTKKPSQEEIKELANTYKRIGTDYYIYTSILTARKERVKILKKWKKTTIKEDHGVKIFDEIDKFTDFSLVPDNSENYSRNIGGCFNIYEPIQHKPKQGEYPVTKFFLEHIFGNYIEIAIDYMTILFTMPAEKLPAICLVSKEQKTGKSTFLHWLSKIYGDNAVVLGNEDFGSNFNTSWASKLIIGIDESFIEKRIIKEKIKRLVTDDTILAENKGVDKIRRDFIAKFILLSNNEDNFIQMEKEDSRFFVLKIPTVSKEDPFLLNKLIDEIPAFLHFLNTRRLYHIKESRLWFKPEDYETDALRAVVKSSKSLIEKTIVEHLADLADNIKANNDHQTINSIKITPKRLAEQVKDDIRYPSGLNLKVIDIFKDWGLIPNPKSERYQYPIFELDAFQGRPERVLNFNSETGKFYTIPFELIDSKICS